MGRSVLDVAVIDSVLSGEPAALAPVELKGLRFGLPERHFQELLHAEVIAVLDSAVARLQEAGVEFVKAELPEVVRLNAAVSFPIVLYETRFALQQYLSDAQLSLTVEELHARIASPDVKTLVGLAIAGHVSQADYEIALHRDRPRLQQAYRDYFAENRLAAILFATTPLPACPIDGSDQTVPLNGRRVPTFETFIRNTDPASNAGIPGLSLPAGLSSLGLPIGIELDGPAGLDRRLLAIGRAVEAALNTTAQTGVPANRLVRHSGRAGVGRIGENRALGVEFEARGFDLSTHGRGLNAMQGLGYIRGSTHSGGMIENYIDAAGLQRAVDGLVKGGDVDRAHELVV
jgi:mandelamide amidase